VSEYKLAIPYAAGIIERLHNGERQLLLQTRWKPERDPVYSGTLEFPAGVLDVQYESVFETVRREIEEEAGLVLKSIKGQDETIVITTDRGDEVVGFSPYYCTQQLKDGKPWVGFIFLCEVEDGEPVAQAGETKAPGWFSYETVRHMVNETPEKFFTLELPALVKYFQE